MTQGLPDLGTPAAGDVIIDPEAEPASGGPSRVSAQQESKFFHDGAAKHRLAQHAQELGWIGKFFGSQAAATNIAGVILVLSCLGLLCTMFIATPEAGEVRKILGGTITTTLGFIFGAATKK